MKRFGFRALACEGFVALSAVVALGACRDTPVQPVATPDVHTQITTAATTTVLNVTLDTYPTGSLGAPWTTFRSGGSTAQIVAATAPHGKVLLLQGSTTTGDSLSTSLGFASSAPQITSAIDIRPVAGASFIWSLHGAASADRLADPRAMAPGLIARAFVGGQCFPSLEIGSILS